MGLRAIYARNNTAGMNKSIEIKWMADQSIKQIECIIAEDMSTVKYHNGNSRKSSWSQIDSILGSVLDLDFIHDDGSKDGTIPYYV